MALREVTADRKPRQRVETETYTGWLYVRKYECPRGELNTHLEGALSLGAVMVGDSGTTPEQARCVAVSTPEEGEGLQMFVTVTWLSIDCGAAALGATTFRFTTKDVETDGIHEKVKLAYGVALTTSDGGIPAIGKTDVRDGSNLTGSTATAITDYVCRGASVIDKWQGRVLIRVEYSKRKAVATYG